MKKITLIAALMLSAAGFAANAQSVTYVEDPSQGLLNNQMKDNWFIQLEGGASVFMSPDDSKVESFGKRIAPSFQLSVGKWFSPVFGLRLNATGFMAKGASDGMYYEKGSIGLREDLDYAEDGYVAQKAWFFGPNLDAMLNLTNWWCGYKADRVYNAVVYGGFGVYWPTSKQGSNYRDVPVKGSIFGTDAWPANNADGEWKGESSRALNLRVGLLNKFRVSNRVDLLLDIRYDYIQEHFDDVKKTRNGNINVLAGIGFNLGKTTWNAPVTAVCPTWKYTDAEGDALAARLQAAEAKIADLEKQLRDCLNRPKEVVKKVEDDGPLATVYFQINRTDVQGVQKKVVNAVAEVMKNSDKDYLLTGWADNYTGNDQINTRLRKGRVATVKNELVKKGVSADRLETQINDGNLTNYGAKSASLDRAVTIEEK